MRSGRWSREPWTSVGLGVLTALGLLLALAGVSGPPPAAVAGPQPVRMAIGLPEPVKWAILGLFALAALLLLAALVPAGLRRRRKKDDDEFEMVIEQPKPSPWVLVVLLAAALVPLAVAGYLLWMGWPGPGIGGGVASHPGPPPAPARPGMPDLAAPPAQAPLFSAAVALAGLAAGVGCVGLLLWLLLGDRMLGVWEGLSPRPPVAAQLAGAVEESLDSLRQEADARRAIIRCYRRFEQVLAGTGLPRAPWETPTEFMRKALRGLRVPGTAVALLTELFEISRFSHHRVGPGERDSAIGSLIEIKAALEREGSDARAA